MAKSSLKKQKIKEIINSNFKSQAPIDVYLINGIKMTSHLAEVDPGCYLLLKDNHPTTIYHMVCWSTVVTINIGAEYRKVHSDSLEIGKIHLPEGKQENGENSPFFNNFIFIYLANGIKLDGLCFSIDINNYIVLEKNGNQQLILWHAIATMSMVSDQGFLIKTHSTEKKNEFMKSLLDRKTRVAIFLKTGIKLQGILTDFMDDGEDDKDWELVLDNKQLIRGQHVSTITENNKNSVNSDYKD